MGHTPNIQNIVTLIFFFQITNAPHGSWGYYLKGSTTTSTSLVIVSWLYFL